MQWQQSCDVVVWMVNGSRLNWLIGCCANQLCAEAVWWATVGPISWMRTVTCCQSLFLSKHGSDLSGYLVGSVHLENWMHGHTTATRGCTSTSFWEIPQIYLTVVQCCFNEAELLFSSYAKCHWSASFDLETVFEIFFSFFIPFLKCF